MQREVMDFVPRLQLAQHLEGSDLAAARSGMQEAGTHPQKFHDPSVASSLSDFRRSLERQRQPLFPIETRGVLQREDQKHSDHASDADRSSDIKETVLAVQHPRPAEQREIAD